MPQKMVGQVYNVGSEKMNYSKRQVCEMIREKVQYYLHFADVGEDADKRNYVVSYKKINGLGFDTMIGLEEGIEELVRAVEVIDTTTPYSNV